MESCHDNTQYDVWSCPMFNVTALCARNTSLYSSHGTLHAQSSQYRKNRDCCFLRYIYQWGGWGGGLIINSSPSPTPHTTRQRNLRTHRCINPLWQGQTGWLPESARKPIYQPQDQQAVPRGRCAISSSSREGIDLGIGAKTVMKKMLILGYYGPDFACAEF